MNNRQFRRLVLDTPSHPSNTTPGSRPDVSASKTLGSRLRANIPMTPRSVTGTSGSSSFASQLAAQNATSQPTKKFRSSAAPKGSKLAAGYTDRTRTRTSTEEDDKASRIQALEEMVKLGQMERETFEKLRDEIVGGEVRDVHLVKGLDWGLLQRVRRGERVDVLGEPGAAAKGETEEEEMQMDVEAGLEDVEKQKVKPVVKEERMKQGKMAPPAPIAGKKRNRNDILRELKAARAKAVEEKKAKTPALGPKFRKLGEKMPGAHIERDEKGRELLVTVDAEGRTKKKVRKVKVEGPEENTSGVNGNGLLMPDKDVAPLGMDAPVLKTAPVVDLEKGDGDIFEGVGADYDPLGSIEDEDEDENSDEDGVVKQDTTENDGTPPAPTKDFTTPESAPDIEDHQADMPPPPPTLTQTSRNYFNDPSQPKDNHSVESTNPLTDPTILAALKKASTISPLSSSTNTPNEASAEAAKLARRRKMLESHDRDAEDMDLGFGSSRFEDAQEEEEDGAKRVKLSVWKGGNDEGEENEAIGGKDGKKRKRGGKKKGDKNSAVDVLRVIERRNEERK